MLPAACPRQPIGEALQQGPILTKIGIRFSTSVPVTLD
jgi:hypothetical protein